MTDKLVDETFRRKQAYKSRFSGHVTHGYSHDQGVKIPFTNVVKNEYLTTYRQRRATEWQPRCLLDHPRPYEIMCNVLYYSHIAHVPNYAGHIPGAQFRCGLTFGRLTTNAKRWLQGDFTPN